jgi:hypothetical protein
MIKKIVLILSLLISNNLYGGTIRPDVPDSKYLEYGKKYECVIKISGQLKDAKDGELTASGSGVVISDHWVLTAAHVLDCMVEPYFLIKNKKYLITETIISPDFDKNASMSPGDIALCYVEEKIELNFFPRLYEKEDEENKTCGIAGYGLTGNAHKGADTSDGERRAGSNKISIVTDSILFCDMSKKNPTSLEFLIAHGDSGGGLFIDGKLAGINSFVSTSNGKPNSKFGDESGHTRISRYKTWIDLHLKFLKRKHN